MYSFINVLLQNQAIQPVGESKSDYEIVLEVAKKMGKYDEVTEGKTIKDWIKYTYEGIGLRSLSIGKNSKKSNTMFSRLPRTGKKTRPA